MKKSIPKKNRLKIFVKDLTKKNDELGNSILNSLQVSGLCIHYLIALSSAGALSSVQTIKLQDKILWKLMVAAEFRFLLLI